MVKLCIVCKEPLDKFSTQNNKCKRRLTCSPKCSKFYNNVYDYLRWAGRLK